MDGVGAPRSIRFHLITKLMICIKVWFRRDSIRHQNTFFFYSFLIYSLALDAALRVQLGRLFFYLFLNLSPLVGRVVILRNILPFETHTTSTETKSQDRPYTFKQLGGNILTIFRYDPVDKFGDT